MSNIVHDQEVEECLEDLLKKVVENLEVEEEEEEEEEENDESEEFNQQWPVSEIFSKNVTLYIFLLPGTSGRFIESFERASWRN